MDRNIRILLIEEDSHLRNIINNYLSPVFSMNCISNISKIYSLLEDIHFHIIILDTKNRYCNSLDVCKYIKENTSSKVIFISTKDDIETKENCFKCGCDYFLRKPFSLKEMNIKINKLAGIYDKNHKIESKGLTLNKKEKTLSVNNCTVLLSNSEYLIIEYMLSNNGLHQSTRLIKYLSAEKGKEVSQGALVVLIKRLRKKLCKGTGMEIIKNRYGRGYYLGALCLILYFLLQFGDQIQCS